jgi:hypothetical protein
MGKHGSENAAMQHQSLWSENFPLRFKGIQTQLQNDQRCMLFSHLHNQVRRNISPLAF